MYLLNVINAGWHKHGCKNLVVKKKIEQKRLLLASLWKLIEEKCRRFLFL